jgi:uncharacterized protein YceK
MNLRSYDVPVSESPNIKLAGHHPAENLVYGGVAVDALAGPGWFDEAAATGNPAYAVLGLYVCLIDLPLSAVGDTLSLPITISAALDRDARKQSVEKSPTSGKADSPGLGDPYRKKATE